MTAPEPAPAAEEVRAQLRASQELAPGYTRTAALEDVRRAAAASGDATLGAEADLAQLLDAAESDTPTRLFAPLTRLLRTLDERPAALTAAQLPTLHRTFPAALDAMVAQPHIALEEIEEWLTEATARTTRAGYSPRGLHRAELSLARHLDDTERVARALHAWRAAPRDAAAECAGCELLLEGELLAGEDDEAALRTWQPLFGGPAPATTSEGDNARSPQGCWRCRRRVLAVSALPLVRLGRLDLARGHHLRGHRLARTAPGALHEVAAHLEFCARTGNERRGMELLDAEQAMGEPGAADPAARLAWLVAVSVLLRRRCELGFGDERLPTPDGARPTAAAVLHHVLEEGLALAARFDERNGTTGVSNHTKVHFAADPLVDALPMHPQPSAPSGGTVDELLDHARALSASGHPGAAAAWRALEAQRQRTSAPLDPAARAELRDHLAMEQARTRPDEAVAQFHAAAAEFEAVQRHGAALACRARAALATAFAGEAHAARRAIEPLAAEAPALLHAGRADVREATAVLLSRVRIESTLLAEDPQPAAAAARLDEELRSLHVLAAPHADDPAVRARLAEVAEWRGRLASSHGDAEQGRALLRTAVEGYRAAGRPWQACGAELSLARALSEADDDAAACEVLAAALDSADHGETPPPTGHLALRLEYAEVWETLERPETAGATWREAALAAEDEDDADGAGALARMRLGGTLLACEAPRAAERVLRRVLPALRADHPPARVVRAQHWLGVAYTELAAHRAAAEAYLAAADTVDTAHAAQRTAQEGAWEPAPHAESAHLSHLAADSYRQAGYDDEAARAYERALAGWRALAEPVPLARALGARVELVLRATERAADPETAGRAAAAEGVALLAEAVAALEQAVPQAETPERSGELTLELGHCQQQTAELLALARPDEPTAAEAAAARAAAAFQEASTAPGEIGEAAHTAWQELQPDVPEQGLTGDAPRARGGVIQ